MGLIANTKKNVQNVAIVTETVEMAILTHVAIHSTTSTRTIAAVSGTYLASA